MELKEGISGSLGRTSVTTKTLIENRTDTIEEKDFRTDPLVDQANRRNTYNSHPPLINEVIKTSNRSQMIFKKEINIVQGFNHIINMSEQCPFRNGKLSKNLDPSSTSIEDTLKRNFYSVESPDKESFHEINIGESEEGNAGENRLINGTTSHQTNFQSNASQTGNALHLPLNLSRGYESLKENNTSRNEENQYYSYESDESIEYDSDIPDEEVEKMLEEALNTKKRKAGEAELDADNPKVPFEEKTKIVLVEKGRNHFDVLPEGWIQVTHNSGMPVYLHKTTRVCTLSRPYFLGPGSARKHLIPVNAIPCLNYKKALENERELQKVEEKRTDDTKLPENLPNARIETVQENIETQNLTAEALRNYCENVFQFQSINVLRFKSWSERRKFTKKRKHESQLQRPTLPDGTKLITFPIKDIDNSEKTNPNAKKEWIMNPNGKSYVCILHEYVQHALKKQPTYQFTELENAATPYAATVIIMDMRYGVGYGTSKKQAKSEAARATLEILIPEMKSKITTDNQTGRTRKEKEQDLSFFDEIRVEDPRIAEFCAKTTEPAPYDILLTCLQRNFGLDDLKIHYQGNTSKHQGNEFTMTVGKYTTTVACKNKRDGKQRASQAILQALHPSITSWGSLLRLYGNHSVKSFKEKKMEEQEITSLQSKAAVNQPNFAILNKLKMELGKLNEKRKTVRPVGLVNTSEGEIILEND